MKTRAVAEFLDSVGINVHLSYPAYGDKIDTVVKPRLKELGVRHIRDGLIPEAWFAGRLKEIRAESGIKATLITSPILQPAADALAFARDSIGVDAIGMIEGINEIDGWFASNYSDWGGVSVSYHKQIYQAFKGDTRTAQIPIAAPTMIWEYNVPIIASLKDYCDVGNMHPYPGGRNPETKGWGGCWARVCYGSLGYNAVRLAGPISLGKPVIATETGYHNATSGEGVSEADAAKYLPRLFLYSFAMGVQRTFSYEFINVWEEAGAQDANWGLLRSDGTPKQAFAALRSLFSLLGADNGGTAGALDLHFSGQTKTLQHVLLRGGSGSFYMALWREAPTAVAEQNVTVKVTGGISDAAVAVPNRESSFRAQAVTGTDSLALSVNDEVVLVRFRATNP